MTAQRGRNCHPRRLHILAGLTQPTAGADILCARDEVALALSSATSGARPTMLDAFKNMTGGKGKLVQKQTDELELLIATAREERSAISAMLTALTARSAKLAPLGKTLEQVSEKATDGHRPARRDRQAPDGARRSHEGARGGRQAHPGPEGIRAPGGADDAEGARPGRRAAEAPRSGAAPVVAGARHAGHARHAQERARHARRAARPAAEGRRRSQAVARPGRDRSRRSSIRSARWRRR